MSNFPTINKEYLVGVVKDTGLILTDLPAISAPYEISLTSVYAISAWTFTNNFLYCYAESAASATTIMTTKTNVNKVIGGSGIEIRVPKNVTYKFYIAAETGGPHTADLNIAIESRW